MTWDVTTISVASGLALVGLVATFLSIDPHYPGNYSDLQAAYDRAPADANPAMRRVVQDVASLHRVTWAFTRQEAKRYLKAGGYCTSPDERGCRPVPRGLEPEGDVIEGGFWNIARHGVSHAMCPPGGCREVPCVHPTNPRCVPGAR